MDDADMTDQRSQHALDANIQKLREQAAQIPPGKPGDCDLCGEWSGRLVKGVCAPCRDKHKLG